MYAIYFPVNAKKKIKYVHQNLRYYKTRANSLYGSKKIESYVWEKNCNI